MTTTSFSSSTFNIPNFELSIDSTSTQNNFEALSKDKQKIIKDFLFAIDVANDILADRTSNNDYHYDNDEYIQVHFDLKALIKDVARWALNRHLFGDGWYSAEVKLFSNDFWKCRNWHNSFEKNDEDFSFEEIEKEYWKNVGENRDDFLFYYESGTGNTSVKFYRTGDKIGLHIWSDPDRYSAWSNVSGIGAFCVDIDFNEFGGEERSYGFVTHFNSYRLYSIFKTNLKSIVEAQNIYYSNLEEWREENDIQMDD